MIRYANLWAMKSGVIKKINLRVRKDNVRAENLYLSMGFRVEGRICNQVVKDGHYIDLIIMGIFFDSQPVLLTRD